MTRSPLRPLAVTVSVTLVLGGFTVSVADLDAPPYTPVIVTDAGAATAMVVTVKLALVAPAATVPLAGTPASAVLLLDSATTAPPVGAALVNVTLPCDVLPPVTLVGFSARVFRLAAGGGGGTGVTVSVLVRLVPL